MKTKNILLLGLMSISNFGFSQLDSFEVTLAPMFSLPEQDGWMYFNTPNNYQPGACFEYYKTQKNDVKNEMLLINSHEDNLSFYKHYKFQQLYKGVPVEGAGCIEHFDPQGNLIFTNAKHAIDIQEDVIPTYNSQQIVDILLDQLPNSNHYAWEHPLWEQEIQADQQDSSASWFPKAKLMLAIDEVKDMYGDIDGSRYKLVYEISVTTLNPNKKTTVYYVNAHDGTIFKTFYAEIENVQADVYGYGNRLIDAAWQGGFVQKYYLFASDGNHNIHTKKFNAGNSPWGSWNETKKAGPDWGDTYLTETSAHYHVTNTWDYFFSTFGRNGYDGNGLELRVATQLPSNNAYYSDPPNSPHYLYFGSTDGGYDYGFEPSVVAHEFTHGITRYTANLAYVNQSGALNESFSDIFGIVYQAVMLDGGVTDWIEGNFIPNDLTLTRSLSNPSSRGVHWSGNYQTDGNGNYVLNQYGNYIPIYELGQPNNFSGNNWCSNCPSSGVENVDNGGVHINSGVQNRWFHILTAGDNNLNIQGIGMTKSARIAYLALTSNLMSSSQYNDSKNATIQAAMQLFGECSQEHISVVRAWNAVSVSAGSPCPGVSVEELVSQDDVIIYPNPTSSTLNFEISKSLDENVRIFDLNGKIVKNLEIKNTYYSTDVSELERGVYFVHFVIRGQTLVKRIVLQ
jgi:Zn-dependent metalloprotease